MQKNHIKILFIIAIFLFGIFSFQNCSQSKSLKIETPSSAAGQGAEVSVAPEVGAPASPPSVPSANPAQSAEWNGQCPGYEGKTKIMDIAIPADHAGTMPRIYSTDRGVFRNGGSSGFLHDEVIVVVFNAPPKDDDFRIGVTHSGGSAGSSSTRTFSISTVPCDFQIPASRDSVWANEANVMAARLSSDTPVAGKIDLVPGKTYYLNIKNKAFNGLSGCGVQHCDIFVSIANP